MPSLYIYIYRIIFFPWIQCRILCLHIWHHKKHDFHESHGMLNFSCSWFVKYHNQKCSKAFILHASLYQQNCKRSSHYLLLLNFWEEKFMNWMRKTSTNILALYMKSLPFSAWDEVDVFVLCYRVFLPPKGSKTRTKNTPK